MVSLDGGVQASDDGTNISIITDGVTAMKIRKSDNQLLLDAGVDSDAF